MKIVSSSYVRLKRFFLLFLLFTPVLSIAQTSSKTELSNPLPSSHKQNDPLETEDELKAIEHLISATERNLEAQKKVRALIVDYHGIQARCLENPEDKDRIFLLAKTASHLLKAIKENYLINIFHPKFISELSLVSQPADKKSLPRP